MFFIIWLMLLTPSHCFLCQTFVWGFSVTARKKGPLSHSSCGRRLRCCLNNSTGHLGPPEANIFGKTLYRFVFSPPRLVFVGCSLNVMYSVPQSSTQKAKSSTSIEWCSWCPLSPKSWVSTHHMVCEKTLRLEFPRLFSVQSISSSLAVSAFTALGLFPLSCWGRCLTFPSSTNFDW